MSIKQLFYLPWWFVRARFFGRKQPLQTVLFISDRCNLQCKHCSVYQQENQHNMTYDEYAEWRDANLDNGRYINLKSWLMGLRHDMIDKEKEPNK